MVDALDLGSSAEMCGSSSLPRGTILKHIQIRPIVREIATSVEGLFKCVLIWADSDNGSTVALQASGRGSIPRRSTIQFLRNKMRAKTNSTFRLSKRAKTMIALMKFKNDQDRHGFKNAMIDAQVAANIVPRTAKERDAK